MDNPERILERAIEDAAVRALRKRAAAKREEAATGITTGEGQHANVIIIASEARAALDIAQDWETIADELESEGIS
jgi:hypothetical protein